MGCARRGPKPLDTHPTGHSLTCITAGEKTLVIQHRIHRIYNCVWLKLPRAQQMSLHGSAGAIRGGSDQAHLHNGLTGAAILEILKQPDGKTGWSHQTMYTANDKLRAEPSRRGERELGSEAPGRTDNAQDKALEKYVHKDIGKKQSC